MVAKVPELATPELFFGFVAPIGADVQGCVSDFRAVLRGLGYDVVELKVTDIFKPISEILRPRKSLKETPQFKRYKSYIKFGNQLRTEALDDAFLATLTISRLYRYRSTQIVSTDKRFQKTAYLMHQFKRKEELELFRSVYGRLFFQISVYSRRGARVDNLAHLFANSAHSANINSFRSKSEKIVQVDENDSDKHGQKVSKIFHDGDFIINTDMQKPLRLAQIDRFCRLLFGDNSISPTKTEYAMFIAKAAALRTLDLSRQVGATIFSTDGEVISIGSNEVPKASGGTYWCDELFDDREYVRGHDSNDRRKREILSEIAEILHIKPSNLIENKEIEDSQFMDALEYGRIIHAEMSAISDAARIGRSIKGSTIFCTTFPCHMCAKHIVAAGISKVVFLEPYPKSLVLDLHSDSIVIEGGDKGKVHSYPSVNFEHFYGISPRRYRELFERGKRKSNGAFQKWEREYPRPNLGVSSPFYVEAEQIIDADYAETFLKAKGLNEECLALKKIVKFSSNSSVEMM